MMNSIHQHTADTVRDFALKLPAAHEDFPWGERVIKVNNKIFVFLWMEGEDHFRCTVKLPASGEMALKLPFTQPSNYNLGKAGWVTVRVPADDEPPLEIILDWVEESYRAVAPKKLYAQIVHSRLK